MSNSVYDPETGEEPAYQSPDLGPGHNRAAGDASDPRGSLKRAESQGSTGSRGGSNLNIGKKVGGAGGSSGGFSFNPDGDTGSVGAKTIKAAESAAGSTGSAEGKLFNVGNSNGTLKFRFKYYMRINRKKGLIGGGVAATAIAIIVAGFMAFIPLKIEHMVSNLQKRTFASSEDATEDATTNMLKRYLVAKVLPAYKDCGTTISKDCRPSNFGPNPVGNLYRTWADNRFENKLAEKYGLEFKYDKASRSWYMKAPDTSGKGIDIGPDGENLDSEFRRTDRAGIRTAMRNALEGETHWKRMMYRHKANRIIKAKYAVRLCASWCGKNDQLVNKADKVEDQIIAKQRMAKLYITQRVLNPRTASLGIVVECLMNPNCSPEKTEPVAIGEEDGAPVNSENAETDTAVRTTLGELAASYGAENVDEMTEAYNKISEKGYGSYALDKVLGKVGMSAMTSKVTNAIPVVGWVTAASDVITFAKNAGPAVQKLGYITNSSAYVSMYMLYRSYADEVHTGHADAIEVGSMSDSLGGGYHGEPGSGQKQVGGTASAEQTPLYQEWINGKSSTRTASLLDSVLPGRAYAASSQRANDEYICNDDKPPSAGEPFCREAVLGQKNPELSATSDFLGKPGTGQIASVAGEISGVTGAISGVIGGIISKIPGVSEVSEFVASKLMPFFMDVVNGLIPNSFGSPMSGASKFVAMAGGANVAGNVYAQTGLGAQEITPEQHAAIINEQQAEAHQDFSQRPLFARMFDTKNQYSLVSKVAMGVPFGSQSAIQSGLATMLSPLGAVSQGFGAMLSGRANAAVSAKPDPFGVTQYGYPEGSIPNDPEAYWDAHCSDDSAKSYQNAAEFAAAPGGKGWAGSTVNDSTTGMPVNKTTNPCMLIKAAVGSAGGWMDTNLLTKFDRATSEGNSAGGQETATVSGDAQELARALIDSGRLSDQDGRYMDQIKNIANGNFTCNVNPYVLEMLYGVVVQDKHTVIMSSLNRYCTNVLTASGTASYHYRDGGGHAIDVVGFDGGAVTGSRNAATLGFLQAAAKYLPKNTGYGQVESCGSGFNIPAGSYPVPDACNHEHIQVPVKKSGSDDSATQH